MMISFRSLLSPLCAALLVGAGLLGACGSSSGGGDLQVVEPRLVKTSTGQRAFTGTLVNNRSSGLSVAQIEVALYDDDGTPVEKIQIEVNEVPARDSVDFSHRIDSDRSFSQAQVQSVYAP